MGREYERTTRNLMVIPQQSSLFSDDFEEAPLRWIVAASTNSYFRRDADHPHKGQFGLRLTTGATVGNTQSIFRTTATPAADPPTGQFRGFILANENLIGSHLTLTLQVNYTRNNNTGVNAQSLFQVRWNATTAQWEYYTVVAGVAAWKALPGITTFVPALAGYDRWSYFELGMDFKRNLYSHFQYNDEIVTLGSPTDVAPRAGSNSPGFRVYVTTYMAVGGTVHTLYLDDLDFPVEGDNV